MYQQKKRYNTAMGVKRQTWRGVIIKAGKGWLGFGGQPQVAMHSQQSLCRPLPNLLTGVTGKQGPYRFVKGALKGPLVVKGRMKDPMQMKTTVVIQ